MARVFKEKRSNGTIKLFFFILAALVVLILIWSSVVSLSTSQNEEQLDIAKNAIVRATVQCYALEAQYPPSLDYLEENYGLVLDKDKYVYHYQIIGQNIMPEVRVFVREANS